MSELTNMLVNTNANVSVTLSLQDLKDLIEHYAQQITFVQDEPAPEDYEKLLTADEVCTELKVSRMTLHRWNKMGYLPCIHVGKSVRYRRSDIENFKINH